MGPRPPACRRTVLVGAGVAGVVLAHVLDYALTHPSGAERARLLAHTGHGWVPSALAAAVGAAALAAGTAVAQGAAGAVLRRASQPGPTFGSPVRELGWLVLWQGGLFAAVEVVERVAVHQSPLALAHGALFPTGLALQGLVATGMLCLLHLLERTGAALAGVAAAALRSSDGRPRSPRPPFARPGEVDVAGVRLGGRVEPRAPPVPSAS